MIVAIKDYKIIGVDKNLLDLLNTNLENLSQKINTINLAFASIKENPLIEIEGEKFEVREIEFINLENIKLYKLEKVMSQTEEKSEVSLENELNLQPQTEEKPEVSLENELNLQPQTEEKPEVSLENELNFQPQTEEKPEVSLENELNLQPQTEEKTEKKPIKLYFEDEFNEIDAMLELNEKEVKEKLEEELKKAAQELNIDKETINELFDELLNQIKESKEEFFKAVQDKDYDQLHKIAHSLKGASLNLRLANLGLILKYIDEKSKEKTPIEQIEMLVNKFYNFVDKISNSSQTENETNPNQIDENIKKLIIETIDIYLETNNEKKFKKDLKYINKLLNTDINSLEDLQNIIKGEK